MSRTKAEPLVIEPAERVFILGLAGAVGKSPRRLKRFINTYRILKGSIDALERETFVLNGGNAGEYREAATLLALVTGAAETSLVLMRSLADHKDSQKVQDFLDQSKSVVVGREAPYVEAAWSSYVEAAKSQQLTLRNLRYWMPRVMRFSFRSGRS